ncbi:MAG: lysoplasmalogenase [Pseudorhodobacter sp.]
MILHYWMFAAAGFAVLYGLGFCWREGEGWLRSTIKTASMALLALAGGVLGAPYWVVAGLALGALGDFFLSRPGTKAFLAGMAAFAMGHLAYAVYFAGLADGAMLFVPLSLAMLALAATTEIWLAPKTGVLRGPVRAYVGVITLMGVAAAGQSALLILAGAGLFILSDVLLALALFVVPTASWRWSLAITLWAAYWLGQFLILQGALAPISAG